MVCSPKSKFRLQTNFKPQGDQPRAIEELTEGILSGLKNQVLIGVTGSGKTFTMANMINNTGKPTLVISHNKTLAAQLYSEFKSFFPENAVEYFVSYYDYYQPEAYIPQTDTYIEKDSSINDTIDRLRLSATTALMEREDVLIVASVSCIFGLGSPKDYRDTLLIINKNEKIERNAMLRRLVDIRYERNDIDFSRGKFRVRGDCVDIFPAYSETAIRVEMFGDTIEAMHEIDPLTGRRINEKERVAVYPATHFVTTEPKLESAVKAALNELEEREKLFRLQGKLLEAQRIRQRTMYDVEMMREIGYCQGIENYSRHLSGRKSGERPSVLLDYFPEDFLIIIDESHVTIPQLRGMYGGDRSRKETLVEHGFRLPSALDNRPLRFEELETLFKQVVYMSATPGPYELARADRVVEQIIRPTGLVDPEMVIKPTETQVDDLVGEIKECVVNGGRALVSTLTKRMAEDLCEYLLELGMKVKYLHSEIKTIERVEILRGLRLGEFDVLVGINLLREGLDLPEVALVAILDADKEGFLRSEKSLIQVAGRAARNVNGRVVLYADRITNSINEATEETARRRRLQMKYNEDNNITPTSIFKSVEEVMYATSIADTYAGKIIKERKDSYLPTTDINELITGLEGEMIRAAKELRFEDAAKIRDEINELKSIKEM